MSDPEKVGIIWVVEYECYSCKRTYLRLFSANEEITWFLRCELDGCYMGNNDKVRVYTLNLGRLWDVGLSLPKHTEVVEF